MPRRSLLLLAFLFTAFALGLIVTGGFVATIGGLRISARSPIVALMLAVLSLVSWFAGARRAGSVYSDLRDAEAWVGANTLALVACIAIAAAVTAAAFHAFSAAGADASGYLSHTVMLLAGSIIRPEALAVAARWPDAAASLAPLGWNAAPEAGFQVPTYAIGLPLLMAPFYAVAGETAASLVIPMTFAIGIVAIGAIARRLAGPVAAVVAAVWLATSPVALLESMQVMSDVPVTAAWLVCWWAAFQNRASVAGALAAIAVLIRPNLSPLAIVPLIYFAHKGDDSSATRRSARLIAFAIPVVLAGCAVAYLQWRYFGSPLRSGYGTAQEIYAWSNVWPNAVLYVEWLLDTHGPWLLTAPLALFVLRSREARHELSSLFVFAALVVIAYLVYAVFEAWTYLRFMLPALAVCMIAVGTLVSAMVSRVWPSGRVVALAVIVLAVAFANVASARSHGVFRFGDRQARARVIGEQLAGFLPVNAVIVSAEHSGAMRYYTGRSVVRWDLIDADAMREAVRWLALNGYQVWVVLDDWEEEAFRRKLPALAAVSLDHRPVFQSSGGTGIRTRAWKAAVLTPPETR